VDIRKISIGADYKGSAMHYIVGQTILNGNYKIHLIRQEHDSSVRIWIIKNDEIVLWKEFNQNIPISIEYNINF
jgi:hypothetical protein|tara:strand:+ start:473 stop:694 length:222 start_codon:yes stop_codon:yes gene_type:complete